MLKYLVLFVTTFVVVFGVIVTYLVFVSPASEPLSPVRVSEGEECQTLFDSGDDKGINFVFMSTGEGAKEEAKEYADLLLQSPPFDKYKNSLNMFWIDYRPPACNELYRDIALLCESRDTTKKAASCPNDYIIVLDKTYGAHIRSSTLGKTISLNTKVTKNVLLHELGHALASLDEEYVPGPLQRGSKNCFEECDDFGVIGTATSGCYRGCSKAERYRSEDEGIMRTLKPRTVPGTIFGIFDDNLLRNAFDEQLASPLLDIVSQELFRITGRAIAEGAGRECSEERYYLISLQRDSTTGNLKEVEKSVEPGCFGRPGYGAASYNLIRNDDTVLEESFSLVGRAEGPMNEKGDIIGGIVEAEEYQVQAPIRLEYKALEIIDERDNTIRVNLADAGARACRTT